MLYRVIFHYFDRFLAEYESRFEKEYGFLRPIIKDVVERYLDCGNPRCGFARIRCPDCGEERLLYFSCRTRGFCPSCHAKRIEEWAEWMRKELLLDVPHRQVVFTIPKMLRVFFKYKRRLLGELCRAAVLALIKYFQATTGTELSPGVVAAVQTFGQKINFHPHAHLLVTEGGEDRNGHFHHISAFSDGILAQMFAREVFALLLREELISEAMVEKIMGWRHSGFSVHSQVRAKTREEAERVGKYMSRPLLSLERLSFSEKEGQVTVRYFGLYANAHRGKVRKGQPAKHPFIIVEEESSRIPRRGWAEMIRKVYEVNPMACPKCRGEMRIIAFISDYTVVDRIIQHLKLTFVAERPPPPHIVSQEFLMAAETGAEYFS